MTIPTEPPSDDFTDRAVEAAIRIGVLGLLLLWCFQIVRPFATPVLWGIIIAIAVYPAYVRLRATMPRRPGLAAALFTIGMLLVLVVPTIYLSALLVDNVDTLTTQLRAGRFAIPAPPDSVATWPLVGKPIATFWGLASTNLTAALEQLAPQIKVVGGWLIATAAGLGLTVIQFVVSVAVAGVLLAHAAEGHGLAHNVARRLAGQRGAEFTNLAEATVRSVARGVLGVAVIQTTLAGAGMVAAGVPAAGVWTLLCLVLAVVQVGVALVMVPAVIYVFTAAPTWVAVLFLIWAVFVSVIDNVLRPLLLGRGLQVPLAVVLIGTIGGMLLSGIIGLFIGAVVLAVGYNLFQAWLDDGVEGSGA